MKTFRLSKIIKSCLLSTILLISYTSFSQHEATSNSEINRTDGKLANGKTIKQALKERGLWKSKDAVKLDSASITQIPIFPGCRKKLSDEKQIKCLSRKMQKYVSTRFRVSKFNNAPKGIHKIYCSFKISMEGSIIDIITFSKYKQDEDEAYRVIASLPKMTPGELNGKPVTVKYMIPISFHVD